MKPVVRCSEAALLFLALVLHAACEKSLHRETRQAFQKILADDRAQEQKIAALEEFVRAYPEPKTNPNLVRAIGMIADHHVRAGHAEIAASWYERAVRLRPDDPDLLNALGYHYALHRMNLDRAVTVLETAVHLAERQGLPERRQGFIKDSLGWAYRMRGDLPLAVAILEEATRLAPGVAVIQEHLAETYHALGERDRAVSLYLGLYLKGRGTSASLLETLRALGAEGGKDYARDVDRRIDDGLRGIEEAERMETEALGASLVRIMTADHRRLSGSLYRPPHGRAGGVTASPLAGGGVLFLHPLGSSRDACAPLAATLATQGLVSLTIDLRGHGASVSQGLPDARAFSLSLADNLRAAEQDVRAALLFLARQPGVQDRRIGIIGAGLGALLAARATRFEEPAPRPAALVLLSPWGRAEAYHEPLSGLPPAAVLLLAGSQEGPSLDVVRNLSPAGGTGDPRSLIVDGPGEHFGIGGRVTALSERILPFLKDSLGFRADARAGAPVTEPPTRIEP